MSSRYSVVNADVVRNQNITVSLPAVPAGYTQTVVLDWRTTGTGADAIVSSPAEFGPSLLGPFEADDNLFQLYSAKFATARPARTVTFSFSNWVDIAISVYTVAGNLVPPTRGNVNMEGVVAATTCPSVTAGPGDLLVNSVIVSDYRRVAPRVGNPLTQHSGAVVTVHISTSGGHRMVTSSGSTGATVWDILDPDQPTPTVLPAIATCLTLQYSPL